MQIRKELNPDGTFKGIYTILYDGTEEQVKIEQNPDGSYKAFSLNIIDGNLYTKEVSSADVPEAKIKFNTETYYWQYTTDSITWYNLGTGQGTGQQPGGSNATIQFNDNGSFGGDSRFLWNKTKPEFVVSEGKIALGTQSVNTTKYPDAHIQIVSSYSDANSNQIVSGYGIYRIECYSNTSSRSPHTAFSRARGTMSSPSNIVSGDRLGGLFWEGFDGATNSFKTAGALLILAGQDWVGSGRGTYMTFETVANGSASRLERMRIHSNGFVGIRTTNPNSHLTLGGSFSLPITTKNTNYTLTDADFCVLVNASGGNITISLPTAVGIPGRLYVIKKIDSSNNQVIIDPAGDETIEDNPSEILDSPYQCVIIISNGANWYIISNV